MEYGINTLSLVSVKAFPRHTSETVNQLLFGELYSAAENQNGWLKIISTYDNYPGWINIKNHTEIPENLYKQLQTTTFATAAELSQTITATDRSFPILLGSSLYEYDGMNFKIGKEKFVYSGQAVSNNSELITPEHIKKFALKYLHAPYSWGGRSPFGIDCSGLSQLVYKLYGKAIPRDAYQQADIGKVINFIHESREGDLAFFDNEEGKINHVGIILGENLIIHASGKVKIDPIDHFGIFNKELKKYSHKLRIIKRIV